jgi:inorganic pyrophosphatase
MWYYNKAYPNVTSSENFVSMYESIAGYGLGGSSIALFGRVGGGIYTKAADVGADLVGKFENGLDEDSPRNPGTIADNVGDNVGDVAGMGADLFGSFAESSSATLVVAATIAEFQANRGAMYFPVAITAFGIVVCLVTSYLATNCTNLTWGDDALSQIEGVLKKQLIVSTVLMTPAIYIACVLFLPSSWGTGETKATRFSAFIAVAAGLWGGLAIGYITEYYTSYAYSPT